MIRMCDMYHVISEKIQKGASREIPFSSHADLLERIFELEDRNLSLIGHFQQSEEEFEEIKGLFHSTAVKLGWKISCQHENCFSSKFSRVKPSVN